MVPDLAGLLRALGEGDVEHLVAMKRARGAPADQADVEQLLSDRASRRAPLPEGRGESSDDPVAFSSRRA